jgi:predicted small lipoprotein YifL
MPPLNRCYLIGLVILLPLTLSLTACSAKRPVLYPNAHYYAVGQATAEGDIEQCMQLARTHGADTDRSERVAKNTAGGAAVGGATGAAAGAVWGSAGRGAAAGAAGGAAAAMTRSMLNSGEPGQVFRRFVEKCLRDKGYAPIGWR